MQHKNLMNKKMITLYIVNDVLGLTGMAVALFWSAGRFDWWPAWAAIAVMLTWLTVTGIVIMRFHPDLLVERLSPPKGAKPWDRTIMSVVRLAQLARYILAGLDQRHGWTGGFPLVIQISGLVACVLGYALFEWATASNNFFSQIVRIQSERGHTVATTGPYRFVRHPGYLGAILAELGLALLLASWWALLASVVCTILFIVRTALEDRTLKEELPGYKDYSLHVRNRLIPGIW